MEFKTETAEGRCQVDVGGELTIYHANEFRDELEKAINSNSDITLNLAEVSEIDTACFQLLMQVEMVCLESKTEFKLVSISPVVREVMEILGLERHFGDLEKVGID